MLGTNSILLEIIIFPSWSTMVYFILCMEAKSALLQNYYLHMFSYLPLKTELTTSVVLWRLSRDPIFKNFFQIATKSTVKLKRFNTPLKPHWIYSSTSPTFATPTTYQSWWTQTLHLYPRGVKFSLLDMIPYRLHIQSSTHSAWI
jgi:hypothetical protein